jgi:hypothetical protein
MLVVVIHSFAADRDWTMRGLEQLYCYNTA